MNENTTDLKHTQLFISGVDSVIQQGEETNYDQAEFESEFTHKDLYFPASDLPERTLQEEDYEKTSIQEEEISGIQAKELLSSSSSDESEQETKKIERSPFKSKFKKFFLSYCEVSSVTCTLRKTWVLLLSVFICSTMALETRNTEKLVLKLFLVSYCCLVYQMIEDLLQYRFLKKKQNSQNEKVECLFDLADKTLLILFISIFNLQYYNVINERILFLSPFLFQLEIVMYRRHCLIAGSQGEMKIFTKTFYMLQSLMIALKMTNIIDFEWRTTLGFLVVYLALKGVYAIFAGLLLVAVCLTSILNLDGRTLCFLRTQILGYIWHIGCFLLNGIGFIILFGLFEKIDSSEEDTIQLGLVSAKYLSFFLMTFSALLFPILKKQEDFNLFQDLGTTLQNQVIRPKKYAIIKTEEQRREAFFLRISSTYFSQLKDISQAQFEEMMMRKNDLENPPQNKEERDFCYICENNISNAILTGCGHGGVCCECAVKLVEQKNECMECRKPAVAIYKIENNHPTDSPAEGIIRAHQLVEIVEI